MTRVNFMHQEISKSVFKAQALEIMRGIEQSGVDVIITSHGKPTLVVKPYKSVKENPLDKLKGAVVLFDDPISPVSEDDWELS